MGSPEGTSPSCEGSRESRADGVAPLRVAPAVHGGPDTGELGMLGIDPGAVLDFSSNQCPLGASPAVRRAVAEAAIDAYPDREATRLTSKLSSRHGLRSGQVLVGSGSTELIRLLAQILLPPGATALSLAPSFGEYRLATVLARAGFEEHRLELGPTGFVYDHQRFCRVLEATRPALCWLCSPHNPTGLALGPALVADLVLAFPGTVFALDEAYCDLLAAPQWTLALLEQGNLVVLRSMTKTWGLAGLRLGYALGHESVIGPLRAAKAPWSVNACALAAGEAALEEEELASEAAAGSGASTPGALLGGAARPLGGSTGSWYHRAVQVVAAGREQLMTGLRRQGWKVVPSAASFFLVEVGDAMKVRRELLRRGCLVRDCTSFGLPAHVRVSPRSSAENERLLAAFAELAATSQGKPDEQGAP